MGKKKRFYLYVLRISLPKGKQLLCEEWLNFEGASVGAFRCQPCLARGQRENLISQVDSDQNSD